MATCYCCCIDLSATPRNIVNIRSRSKEYRTLYDIADAVLKFEEKEVQPREIHEKLDGVICNSCWKVLKKYGDAIVAIEPIKARMKEFFLVMVSSCH